MPSSELCIHTTRPPEMISWQICVNTEYMFGPTVSQLFSIDIWSPWSVLNHEEEWFYWNAVCLWYVKQIYKGLYGFPSSHQIFQGQFFWWNRIRWTLLGGWKNTQDCGWEAQITPIKQVHRGWLGRGGGGWWSYYLCSLHCAFSVRNTSLIR